MNLFGRSTAVVVLIASSLALLPLAVEAAEVRKTQQNVMTEISFTSLTQREDPFNTVVLDVVFTEADGTTRRVPAFWAGGTTWKVRYASPVIGMHRFRSESSDASDAGLHGVEGSVEVDAYKGDHPLYTRGPLRVAGDNRSFEHADGTPFLWLGDTWWMGLTKRLSWPGEFQTLAADRKKKGFNLIQIVAGLYPDMPAFDERGANEAGFPWEKEYARIRPEYFDAADKKILYLVEQGFVPCIVSTWGYHLPWLGEKKMKQHQRYVYARWGALPMVWCAGGEITLPWYLEPGFPQGGPKQTADWIPVIQYCHSINAFDRMITGHPSMPAPYSMRNSFKDPETLLDFDMLQTPHGQLDALAPTVQFVRHSYAAKPPMPVVNAEPSYEMLFDKTPPMIARMMFWVSWANGVKGYTYGANGIWQVNGREKPYGKSPHGGDYGQIPWEDAMNLAGGAQVALGTKLLGEYEWQKFEPRADWAAWAGAKSTDVSLGDWIWFPEGQPTHDAPVAPRFFRRAFDLPEEAKVRSAVLSVAADDQCSVWLNGKEIGSHQDWRNPGRFEVMGSKLKPGRNVLAIRAENGKADVAHNPAGLICGMVIELENGKRIEIKSAADWRAGKDHISGWQQPDFDAAAWPTAQMIARFGDSPWGRIGEAGADEYLVPYAMGIERETRVVYVPQPNAVAINKLESGVAYAAFYFDPATGDRKEAPEIKGDARGIARVEAPDFGHDWVLVLEAKK